MLVLRIGKRAVLPGMDNDALLRRHGMLQERVTSRREAAEYLRLYDYDVIVMEERLREGPCHEAVRQLRADGCAVPIVILGDAATRMKAMALDLGADDFITLPCATEELLARIRAVVRRSRGHAESVLRAGQMAFSLSQRQLRVGGKVLALTRHEALVLELLFLKQGAVVTRDALFNHLYCGQDERELKALDVVVCRLRKKLAAAGLPSLVGTVWGLGYTLRNSDDAAAAACAVGMEEPAGPPGGLAVDLDVCGPRPVGV